MSGDWVWQSSPPPPVVGRIMAPKMPVASSPKPGDTLPYIAKGTLQI